MKKAFGLLVIACLLALCGLAASESLASPGNVHWKEGSTATAVWDAVEGANYYQVEVHVYHDGEEIGYAETGTTDCEADVQAQINMIVNNAQYVYVDVSFAVKAINNVDPQNQIYGSYSGQSSICSYLLSELQTPQNLSLSEEGILSWDVVEGAQSHQYIMKRFEMYHEDSNGGHHTIGNITEFENEVAFEFDMPELPDAIDGYQREFSLVRIHEGRAERIPVTIGNDGKFRGRSEQFSDFVLMYEDEPIQDNQQVTVEYSFSSETAIIGQPFTVNYEIKGGSGQYENFSYMVDEITEHCCIGDQSGELTSSKGSFTVVPESGENINVWVSCTDSVTGIHWGENQSGYLPCYPRSDIPVSITNIPENLAVNELFAVNYLIGGSVTLGEAKAEVWEFSRNETYPDQMYTVSLNNTSGSLTYTPKAGKQLYISIVGKTENGQPFYAKTGRLNVDTTNAYDPVTVEYSFGSESATIGQPFTVNYEIKGGSGLYENLSYMVDEITEHCCIGDQSGELTSSKGSFTVVPESGENINVWVSCTDSVTGIHWGENQSGYLPCCPGADIPIKITPTSNIIAVNERFSFDYLIGSNDDIDEAKAEIWIFARNDTYPDCVLEHNIDINAGTCTYTPLTGDQLYIAVRGKDAAGRPFYARTDRIAIDKNIPVKPIIVGEEDVNCYINMPGNGVLFQGGEVWQDSLIVNCFVDNPEYFAKNYPDTEPVWTINQTSGQNMPIDSWTTAWGQSPHLIRYFRAELLEIPENEGDAVFEVSCTWGGQTSVKTIIVHCIDIEWPDGLINIEDTVHTYVGAKLTFQPEITPAGWKVLTYPQLRWGFDDNTDDFAVYVPGKKDESLDQYKDIIDKNSLRITESGIYESTYVIKSDKVSVGRLVTFEIDKNPNWTFRLPTGIKQIEANAFEGITTEAVYIPYGCESIGDGAFAESNISVIYIPATVTTIGKKALPSDVFIYTPENSPASIWAESNGYEDYQIVAISE